MPDYKFLFHHLSATICGMPEIEKDLSNEYYDILNADAAIAVNIKSILDKYNEILQTNPPDIIAEIKSKILIEEALKELVRKIIKIWYLGKPDVKELKGEKYFYHYEALIWKVAHAHPAGLGGGYYGYWHYRPEN